MFKVQSRSLARPGQRANPDALADARIANRQPERAICYLVDDVRTAVTAWQATGDAVLEG